MILCAVCRALSLCKGCELAQGGVQRGVVIVTFVAPIGSMNGRRCRLILCRPSCDQRGLNKFLFLAVHVFLEG
jgi:hypothetical protein